MDYAKATVNMMMASNVPINCKSSRVPSSNQEFDLPSLYLKKGWNLH